jgi:hypothetical protein
MFWAFKLSFVVDSLYFLMAWRLFGLLFEKSGKFLFESSEAPFLVMCDPCMNEL